MRMFIFFCQHCEREFQRPKRGYKYCSKACHNHAQTTKKSRIVRYAESGANATYAAARLGMARVTLRLLMRKYGLYRTWQLARFKKCRNAA